MDTNMSKEKQPNFERSLGFLIHDVARLFRVTFDREVSDVGLTRAQWFVLGHVVRTQGQTQIALAEETDMEKAPLGKVLDRLEQGGWIERRTDPRDRRARCVFKTDKVDPLIPFMEAAAKRVDQTVMAGFDDKEKERLLDALMVMKSNLLNPQGKRTTPENAGHDRKTAARLKRPLNPMPEFIKRALVMASLMEAYDRRPPYQRNDYIGWITRAKREETRLKRLRQMLDELKCGDAYMKMKWQPKRG
jgi:DNA-binding MarR family transcriptional regulator